MDLGDVETQDDEIFYSIGSNEWPGFNGLTPETYSTYTGVVNDRMTGGFVYFGTDGTICRNEEFGTIEVLSEDPLSVQYTIHEDATWSDGNPVDYADALLDWAAQNPAFADANGEPLFNHVSGGNYPEYVPEGPQGEIGSKEFVLDFPVVYADWELLVSGWLPAHVVAEQIGITEDELAQAILDEDIETITQAAEFWNTGWLSPTPGELPDPALTPVAGPYKLASWEAGQSITLEANEDYWGTPAATQRLTFRQAAPETQVQALQNGDLNIIEPQASVDTLAQLEGLGDAVTIQTGETLTWEHLDFNFKNGPFADSLPLREAFAMCVPRQQIIDNLIAPVAPDAVVMNAREVFPFQDTYDEVVDAAYDGRYDEVDIEGATAKIEEAGVATPVDVRIGYSAPNQRRSDEVSAIKSSCDQAGFNIIDAGNQDFFQPGGTQERGDYEVALFAWAGSGQIASGQNIYATGNPQNYGGYSDPVVDEAWDTLASTVDPEVHLEQVKIIEKQLWDTLYGIPVFAHPGLIAADSTIQNVRKTAGQDGAPWNAEQWVRAE
ncbi:ABC transporter substrate-binding protein [Cellulomonas sp. ATA003]|nr:ABC transporter substrate-binding protein [Cellulomonas sp. ATA003]WNB85025.1 ABC transporter substrate-binding protein [Cellulomonas sp. ATA003]